MSITAKLCRLIAIHFFAFEVLLHLQCDVECPQPYVPAPVSEGVTYFVKCIFVKRGQRACTHSLDLAYCVGMHCELCLLDCNCGGRRYFKCELLSLSLLSFCLTVSLLVVVIVKFVFNAEVFPDKFSSTLLKVLFVAQDLY